MIFDTPTLTGSEEEVLEKIRKLWTELRHNLVTQPKRWTQELARNLRARAIQGSNSIEGFHVTREDALAAIDGDGPAEADPAAWSAVKGYQTAMNFVLRLGSASEFSYDANLLTGLHFMMVNGDQRANPGTWRPGAVFVKNGATGEIVYTAPDRKLVPELINELCKRLTADDTKGPTRMVRAAMAHLNFVMIHPFSDGNGRMSRCLQTLVLARYCESAEKAWNKLIAGQKKTPLEAARILSAAGIADFQETGIGPGTLGALVAFPSTKGGPQLCEFQSSNFQPELKDDGMWFVSMGSGQIIADSYLAFMRDAFWRDGMPELKHGMFAAAWVMRQSIRVAPGFIAEPIDIAVLQRDQAHMLEAGELTYYMDVADQATRHFGTFDPSTTAPGTEQVPTTPAQPIPEPPAPK